MHKLLLDVIILWIWLLKPAVAYNFSAEWSAWGQYGNCSIPCGGGLSNKTRTCSGASRACTGTSIHYKVCNTLGCGSEGLLIRDKQCQSFNKDFIKGNYFHWVPYHSSAEPCALYCRTVETGFILKLQTTAWDGAVCGMHGGGVCIGGHCRKVGCDDIVGSKRKLDPCGVCGGNGTSCDRSRDHKNHYEVDRNRFHWDIGWSMCSKTCGKGLQVPYEVCRNSDTGKKVSSTFCSNLTKPYTPKTRECVIGDCTEWLIGSWSHCSVTCGYGQQKRKVVCRASLSQKCITGHRPSTVQKCYAGKTCDLGGFQQDGIEPYSNATFVWRHRKYEPCSQTCGSGTQSSMFECVEVSSEQSVADHQCETLIKPDPTTQYCNAIDCPPAWRVSEYGVCSVPCGGGMQSRDIECVQMTKYGDMETLPFYRCPEPIPVFERSCNLKFCLGEWTTGSWTKCSVTCGMGFEYRPIFCVKNLKNGLHVNVSDSECIRQRPTIMRSCHSGDCYKLQKLPEIKERKGTFIQTQRTKRIQLFVGETAILLPNQSVKIMCPVRNFQKKLIFWTKNNRLIPLVGRVRVSSYGAIRITRANPILDAGVFTCSAGLLHAGVNLTFQTKREAKLQSNEILNSIFNTNFNESKFQADGSSKLKNTKYLNINSIDDSGAYDYSSFTTSNWTLCSENCGWGTQTRIVTCNHMTEKFIRLLPDEECLQRGLEKPMHGRKCMTEQECPTWTAGKWSQCTDENCGKVGHSVQTRVVMCRYKDETLAKEHKCSGQRPLNKKYCKNANCTAVWQTSKWSECTSLCGVRGKKLRTLRCVWVTTKLPAFNVCRNKAKPSLSKPCKPAPCGYSTCVDSSLYCVLARQLKMCRYQKFRRKCCKTCLRANLNLTN